MSIGKITFEPTSDLPVLNASATDIATLYSIRPMTSSSATV